MSEELAAETPDAAIRAYLFAIGFTLVLIGGEMMAEKPDPRFYTGLILVILGLPVHLSWVFWKKLKPWLGTSQLSEASAIATSVRWWLGILLVFLASAVLSPFVERKWPFSQEPIVIIVSAALLLIIGSVIGAAMWSNRSLHIPSVPEVPLHMALYVGQFWADVTQVNDEMYFTITIRLFNQSDSDIAIESVRGNLVFAHFTKMAAVSLVENLPLTIVAHNHDGATVTIRQGVSKEQKDRICEVLASDGNLIFDFDLIRFLARAPERTELIWLPNLDGVTCRRPKDGDIICGRLVKLQASGLVVGKA